MTVGGVTVGAGDGYVVRSVLGGGYVLDMEGEMTVVGVMMVGGMKEPKTVLCVVLLC